MSLAIAGCTGGEAGTTPEGTGSGETVRLTLVSYAVTQRAYESIIPKFVEDWKAKTGQTVEFDQSYAGSGTQTRAIIDGLEADVAALAIAADTLKLQEAELIEPGWEQEVPTGNGIVHKSVAALINRPNKPLVDAWSELAQPGVQVITANPRTSGGARWNFLAIWGAIAENGGTEAEALEFTEKVFRNVPILPKDAREATDVFFKQGQGDVLINYENEVILANQQGENLPYAVPTDINISIDNPIAVVDANVDKHETREVAEAFVQFLFTPEAQQEFAKVGFRPTNAEVEREFANDFPKIDKLFTSNDFGGWAAIDEKFFNDGAIFEQIQTKIAQG